MNRYLQLPLVTLQRAISLMILCACISASTAFCQATTEEISIHIDNDLDASESLLKFAKQTHHEIVFNPSVVNRYQLCSVTGMMTPEEALFQLLKGTPLGFTSDEESRAFAIHFSEEKSQDLTTEPSGRFLVETNQNPENQETRSMNRKKTFISKWIGGFIGAIIAVNTPQVVGQDVDEESAEEEIYELSPFEISTSSDIGYLATSTLAGTRLNTDLKDVGSAISVITKEFLTDTGAVDNETLLMYTTNTEVGGVLTSYSGASLGQTAEESQHFTRPNSNTRVRGLDAADNTRDFFITSIPWDAYNIERVDLQRGPNSILFGLGSPAGIINTATQTAQFSDSNEIQARYGSYNSQRVTANINRVIIEEELAIRVAALKERQYFRQNPAYEDDQRAFATFRYEPKFLKNRGIYASLRGNVEAGTINSNRPRTLTPTDYINAWFRSPGDPLGGLGKKTFNPFTVQDYDENHPDWGSAIPATASGSDNPSYLPALGAFGQEFGGPIAIYGNANGTPDVFMIAEPDGTTGTGGIDADGNYDGTVFPYNRMVGITPFYNYAVRVGLPYADFGQYKDFGLRDSSIFNYYKQLIDGSNKREWNNFHSYNLAGNLNFLNNMFGIEAVYDYQDFDRGSMGGVFNAIYIDVNENYGDFSANQNLGRPYATTNHRYGNGTTTSVRESKRVTAYADFNLQDILEKDNWWVRLLGRHTFTMLLSDDSNSEDTRSFMKYGTTNEYGTYVGTDAQTDPMRYISSYLYLGDSLINNSSAAGAHIPNPNGKYQLPSMDYRLFDSSWTATDVDPADPFTYAYGLETTQSENPANYAGWFNYPMTVLSAENENQRDALTYNASKDFERIKSAALVWQGYMWDKSVVATFGWRRDRAKAWLRSADTNAYNAAVLDETYQFTDDPQNIVKSESRSYSLAWHVSDFVDTWFQLPVNVSLYYNRSTNFQPAAGRVDLMGNALSAPNGKTVDRSILISTKDNRYSLKITHYENSVNLANSAAFGQTFMLGGIEAWAGMYTNIFEYDLGGFTFDSAYTGAESRYNYVPAVGETAEDAAAREAAAIAGWRAHQLRIRQEFPGFYDIWLDRDPTEEGWISVHAPAGFALTEDTVSKGYEFEFIANPTNNWRIAINASKVEAIRQNVGGELMSRFMNLMLDDLRNTPAGDIRIWWGSAGSPTAVNNFMQTAGAEWELVKLKEGTSADEIREWHFNVVTNYSFSEGKLKGFNVGGSYRWEDDIVIGYPLMESADGITTYNLNDPYKGPANGYIDLWAGYNKQLKGGIDWRIQLNVRNAFASDDLIPLTTQPDGTPAAYRIPPSTVWTLTNTFRF